MGAKEEAERLSLKMRGILIAHVKERQPVDVAIGSEAGLARRAVLALHSRGLIRYDTFGGVKKPKFTELTELGRATACYVLGQYADALVGAGILERPPTISVRWRTAYSIVPDGEVEVIAPADIKSSSAPVS